MLKISEIATSQEIIILRLEGQIVGPWVAELDQACEPLAKNGHPFALDLTEVVFVDEPGINTLNHLSANGVQLLNATPFVAAQLQAGGSRAARTPPA